jgi:hypothetical protein
MRRTPRKTQRMKFGSWEFAVARARCR